MAEGAVSSKVPDACAISATTYRYPISLPEETTPVADLVRKSYYLWYDYDAQELDTAPRVRQFTPEQIERHVREAEESA